MLMNRMDDVATGYREQLYATYGVFNSRDPEPLDPDRMNELYGRFLSEGLHDVLEFGAGTGKFAEWLSSKGVAQVRAWDASMEQVVQAAANCRRVRHGDLFAVLQNQPEQSVDGIVVLDVLEHLKRSELLAFAADASRVLRRGGRLLVQTPNGEGIGVASVWSGDLTHETLLTVSTMSQLFTPFNLTMSAAWGVTPGSLTIRRALRSTAWKLIAGLASVADVIQTGKRRAAYERVICALFIKGK